MALSLPIPAIAWAEQDITLGGLNYTFTFSYNSRDTRWRFDISLNNSIVITGIKVVENQSLLERYKLDEFSHGDILCVRLKDDDEAVGRNNLGIDLSYELVYFTNAELEAL